MRLKTQVIYDEKDIKKLNHIRIEGHVFGV